MLTNPKHITWVNPLTGTDQNGNVITWNPQTDMKGIELQFDGGTPIEVDCGFVTSYDMSQLAQYKALPAGQHTVDMCILTDEGVLSGFSASVTFLIAVVPLAPTNVALA